VLRSRGAEIELPPGAGAGAEITNCGPAPFYKGKICINQIKKNSGTQVKQIIFKVSFKTIRSWSRNLDLRLHGAGAKNNVFGFAALSHSALFSWQKIFAGLEISDKSFVFLYTH
jgi:hypothetical protein